MKNHLPSQHHLHISIDQQLLEVFESTKNASEPIASYKISSSKFGLGTEPGSFRTPLGKFLIKEKIGEGVPERMKFEGRVVTGTTAALGGTEDHILTRILWLSGLEPHNANTCERFIYIHGTNQEELLGTPASHGCIRLGNAEMIELFNHVQKGDTVEIVT